MEHDKYHWQEKALQSFKKNSYKGICIAPTGAGKTMFAIKCIIEIDCPTLIIVPTVVLLNQWVKELEILNQNVGQYYGEKKDIKNITVAVINSAITLDHPEQIFKFAIFDETHHYAATESRKLVEIDFLYKLGITATLQRQDQQETFLEHNIGPIIYSLSESRAQRDNLINEFTLINVAINLEEDEQEQYNELDQYIRANFDYKKTFLQHNYKYKQAVQARKNIINIAKQKIIECSKIVQQNQDKKIIIFNQLNEMSDKICNEINLTNCFVIYSGIKKKDLKNMLENFSNWPSGVLVSTKMFDEGLNIPSINIAIIVAGDSTARQIKQRVGRCLRKKSEESTIFQIYAANTVDEKYCKKRTETLKEYCKQVKWI